MSSKIDFYYFLINLVNSLNRLFQKKIIPNGEIQSVLWSFTDEEKTLIEDFNKSTNNFLNMMNLYQIRKSYIILEEKFDFINKFIGKTEVWRISDNTLKNKTIFIAFEMLKITALLLLSFVPSVSNDILDSLGIKENNRNLNNVMFRNFEKEFVSNENFHHEKSDKFFMINLAEKKKFFRKKISTE